METKNHDLANLKNSMSAKRVRAEKVEYKEFPGTVLKRNTIIVTNTENSSYLNEINSLEAKPLDKRDIVNIKKYSNFMKYWFDQKNQTITIGSRKYNIYKVHGTIFFKNTRLKMDIINANKEFKIARILNKTKLLQKMVQKICDNEVKI